MGKSRTTNLRPEPATFIGRERELVEVQRLLRNHRLVTLTGAGGCGKTRLALKGGEQSQRTFRHGLWLLDRPPRADPTLVPQTLPSVFELQPASKADLIETISDYLRPRDVLL